MKIKLLSIAFGAALSASVLTASAQKAYTEGVLTLNQSIMGTTVPVKTYFTADSVVSTFSQGPANIKILANSKQTYFAVLVDVPVMQKKFAGIATPDEVDQQKGQFPTYTFTPTTETKQISGFNCKKVVAKDNKSGQTMEIWITNDITLPAGVTPSFLANAGGFPVQYQSTIQGQQTTVTLTAIEAQKVPKGTFGITADYQRMTLEELQSMARGGGE